MKIDDVPRPARRHGAPPEPRGERARILACLAERPDEVFSATACDEIAAALGVKLSTVRQALWTLARDGFAGKARLERGVWYGSHDAIETLISACEAEGVRCEPL